MKRLLLKNNNLKVTNNKVAVIRLFRSKVTRTLRCAATLKPQNLKPDNLKFYEHQL